MNISIKKIGTLVLFMVSIFILSGCELLEPGTQDGGATPIYQGMTISDSMQNLSAQSSENKPSKFRLNKSYFFNAAFTIDDAIGDEFEFENNEELDYYSPINTDLYITVNLHNPDGQTILRFTLNGIIYQSFQFQEGSDSEHLILKVNSGSTAGIKEFTIDEIKYVENVTNLTKDTLFEGDKTIQLGVTYNSIPTATVNNEVVNATSFSLDLVITDEEELISKSGNLFKALLYDGEEVVQTKDLTIDSTSTRFDKLNPNQNYEYAIATVIDSLDGNNNRIHILHSGEITTTDLLTVENVVLTQDTITFEINVTDVDDVGSITAIELYKGETLVEALTDLGLRTFTNLLSNNEYQIKVTYTYDLNDGIGEQTIVVSDEVTTQAKATPVVLIENVVSTQDTITFEINVTDVDDVGSITEIELYQGEKLVEALTDLSLRTFTNLLSSNAYQVKVTYTYDLNDGDGEQTLVITKDSTTQAKATPVVLIENAVSTQDYITFNINITDVDEVGSITAIELYQGETLVEALTDLSLRTFTNLLSDNEYQIKVTYTHDLNDGAGEQTVIVSESKTTLSKATPIVLIENVVSTQTSIGFGITVIDVDQVGALSAIELYQGETLVEVLTDLSVREFTGLLSNNEYTIKVTYTYDLNDGVGAQTLTINQAATTLAKATPTVVIDNVVPTQTSIGFGITVTDVDQVGAVSAIELYQGETLVEALTDLSVREFTGLLSNNEYTIKVTYTYDLNDGVGAQTLTIIQTGTTIAKATPTVVIDNVVPTQTSIGFGITVTDVDQVGSITAIELYKGETLIEALTDLILREFTGLLSNNEYTVKVTYTYDLNDGLDLTTLLLSELVVTPKIIPQVTINIDEIKAFSVNYSIDVSDPNQTGEITAIYGMVKSNQLFDWDYNPLTRRDLSLSLSGTLENIDSNKVQYIYVEYSYDINDGNGKVTTIYQQEFQTSKVNRSYNAYLGTATYDSLEINLDLIDEDGAETRNISMTLYNKAKTEIISTRDFTYKDMGGAFVFIYTNLYNNLLSGTTYCLVITYESDLNDGLGFIEYRYEKEFTTLSKTAPTVIVNSTTTTQNLISFDLEINDPDNVGAVTAIELYKGETLIEALTDLSVREFTGLLSNNEYTIKVTYTYDLNDGVGAQTLTINQAATTLAKATPTVVIDNVVPTQTSIGFGITVTDVDQVGAISAIELYKGETLIKALTDLSVREFTGLLSNNEYIIKVTYTYDLNDGAGSQTLITSQAATTVAKATPVVAIDNVVPTQTSIGFGITVTDVDQVGAVSAIELYQGETLVEALTDLSVREFTGLLTNNEYTIKVTYTYDLNDGVGLLVTNSTKTIRTLVEAIEILSETILNTEPLKVGDTIVMQLNVTNPSGINIQSIVLNDTVVSVSGGNRITTIIVSFDPNSSGGLFEYIINSFIYMIDNNTYESDTLYEFRESIMILGTIILNDFIYETNNIFIDDMPLLEIAINNETGYIINSVTVKYGNPSGDLGINGYSTRIFLFESITSGEGFIKIPWPTNYTATSVEVIVTNISYGFDEYGYTNLEINNLRATFNPLKSSTVRYISSVSDLINIEHGYIYELQNDIDLLGVDWTPINYFYGVIDGKGYSIKNYTKIVNNTSYDQIYIGIFKKLLGTIINLDIENFYVSINTNGSIGAGTLAVESSAYIENNHVINASYNISTTSEYHLGGLTAWGNYSIFISNSVSGSNFFISSSYEYGQMYSGGITSGSRNSEFLNNTIISSVFQVEANMSMIHFGGIVGYADNSEINMNYFNSIINSSSRFTWIGGIAAKSSNSIVKNNLFGINAEINATTIWTCEDMNIFPRTNIGGIIGDAANVLEVKNNLSYGHIEISSPYLSYVGGISGGVHTDFDLNNIQANLFAGSINASGWKMYANEICGGIYVSNNYTSFDRSIYKYGAESFKFATIVATLENLNNIDFYILVLNLDSSIWSFDNLDYLNNVLPYLK